MANRLNDLSFRVNAEDNVTIPFKQMESSLIRFVGAVTAGLAALNTAAFGVRAAADLQKELLNVQKTTSFTDATINVLSDDLKKMSEQVNISAVDLAKIAAIGGQLGLGNQGAEALRQFTETTARMSSVLDIAVEDAANGIAKMTNIFNIGLKDAERIASAFNELSNNSTASGKDLLDIVQRIGDAGGTIDIKESLALAATGRDMGLTLETVGTSFTKVFLDMQAQADNFARAMGISTQEWAGMVEKDGIGALKAYLAFLRTLRSEERARAIEQLSGGGRIFSLVNKLVQDGENAILNRNLGSATRGYDEGTSALREQETVLKGLNAQAQILQNTFTSLAITIGNEALPYITDLVREMQLWLKDPDVKNGIKDLARDIGSLVRGLVNLIKWVADLNFNWENMARLLGVFVLAKVAEGFLKWGAAIAPVRAALDQISKVNLTGIGKFGATSFASAATGLKSISENLKAATSQSSLLDVLKNKVQDIAKATSSIASTPVNRQTVGSAAGAAGSAIGSVGKSFVSGAATAAGKLFGLEDQVAGTKEVMAAKKIQAEAEVALTKAKVDQEIAAERLRLAEQRAIEAEWTAAHKAEAATRLITSKNEAAERVLLAKTTALEQATAAKIAAKEAALAQQVADKEITTKQAAQRLAASQRMHAEILASAIAKDAAVVASAIEANNKILASELERSAAVAANAKREAAFYKQTYDEKATAATKAAAVEATAIADTKTAASKAFSSFGSIVTGVIRGFGVAISRLLNVFMFASLIAMFLDMFGWLDKLTDKFWQLTDAIGITSQAAREAKRKLQADADKGSEDRAKKEAKDDEVRSRAQKLGAPDAGAFRSSLDTAAGDKTQTLAATKTFLDQMVTAQQLLNAETEKWGAYQAKNIVVVNALKDAYKQLTNTEDSIADVQRKLDKIPAAKRNANNTEFSVLSTTMEDLQHQRGLILNEVKRLSSAIGNEEDKRYAQSLARQADYNAKMVAGMSEFAKTLDEKSAKEIKERLIPIRVTVDDLSSIDEAKKKVDERLIALQKKKDRKETLSPEEQTNFKFLTDEQQRLDTEARNKTAELLNKQQALVILLRELGANEYLIKLFEDKDVNVVQALVQLADKAKGAGLQLTGENLTGLKDNKPTGEFKGRAQDESRARFALETAKLEAQLKLQRQVREQDFAVTEDLYNRGLLSLSEYLRRKTELQEKGVDDDIAIKQRELKAAKEAEDTARNIEKNEVNAIAAQANQAKIKGEIKLLESRRANIQKEVGRERIAAERLLGDQLLSLQQEYLNKYGDNVAAASIQFAQQFRDKLVAAQTAAADAQQRLNTAVGAGGDTKLVESIKKELDDANLTVDLIGKIIRFDLDQTNLRDIQQKLEFNAGGKFNATQVAAGTTEFFDEVKRTYLPLLDDLQNKINANPGDAGLKRQLDTLDMAFRQTITSAFDLGRTLDTAFARRVEVDVKVGDISEFEGGEKLAQYRREVEATRVANNIAVMEATGGYARWGEQLERLKDEYRSLRVSVSQLAEQVNRDTATAFENFFDTFFDRATTLQEKIRALLFELASVVRKAASKSIADRLFGQDKGPGSWGDTVSQGLSQTGAKNGNEEDTPLGGIKSFFSRITGFFTGKKEGATGLEAGSTPARPLFTQETKPLSVLGGTPGAAGLPGATLAAGSTPANPLWVKSVDGVATAALTPGQVGVLSGGPGTPPLPTVELERSEVAVTQAIEAIDVRLESGLTSTASQVSSGGLGFGSLFSSIGKFFSGAIDMVKSLFSNVGSMVSGAASGVGGFLKGLIPGFATGGYVSGPGTSTSDSIPARLSHGEYVVKASATRQWLPLLEYINSGRFMGKVKVPKAMRFAEGGLVNVNETVGKTASGQSVRIVNVVDPAITGDYLASAQGEKAILNIISRNAQTLRYALG